MAQAAFFVNDLKVIDKGEHLIIEGTNTCQGGHVIDTVFLKVPAALKHVFADADAPDEKQAPPEQPPKARPDRSRVRRYLGEN